MNVKKEAVVVAYRILDNAKISKMNDEEKFLVIRAMRQLKPVAEDYDGFVKDAAQRLRPEGYDAIEAKQGMDLTPEEEAVAAKYNDDITRCVREELDKEVELTFTPLPDEAMGRFISSNDLSVRELMLVMDVIGE